MTDFLERRKEAPLPLISGPQTREYEAIADRIASSSPGRLLDWGCGWGQVSKMLLDRGVDVTSFEYREGYTGTGMERLEKFPEIEADVSGDPVALPYPDESFDTVLSSGVLEHVADPDASLDELRRVLKPGGKLLITTHGTSYLPRLDAAERAAFEQGELVVRWSEVVGSNLCSAYHPERYLRDTFAEGFAFLELEPEGARGNPTQDLVLLQKTP